ncbi:anthranilate synthase component I family protein [Pirellulales bacterium]|nr:anthranilate synthase component I family protein [Pirellulales bacterium]
MSDDSLPLAEELPATLTASEAFTRLAGLPHVVYFDSAVSGDAGGRYSFFAADPFAWIEAPADGRDALADVEKTMARFRQQTRSDLPPFQGGLAGLLGYELGRSFERIDAARHNDLPTPALAVGCYDVVLAFDHQQKRGWIISQGFPAQDPGERTRRAESRLAEFRDHLNGKAAATNSSRDDHFRTTTSDLCAPQHETRFDGVTSNLSPDEYRAMVRLGIDYIRAGDVFQVNLAQRLLCRATSPSHELYLRLRDRNPAPYAGYFDLGEAQICSASPECFLTVRDGWAETRPIKGTRGRSSHVEADLFAGDELLESEKDRAENVMIVDLVRNDLSRVCQPGSVHAAQLCRLETYAYVKHLVSVVRGELAPGKSALDLLRAAFPGGSITGAPKVRAMEIIAELEPTVRGPYCGSLAYLGFDGQFDASILIRTVTATGGWWQFPVGGGVVAQSDPDDEYRETWHKARGLLEAVVL